MESLLQVGELKCRSDKQQEDKISPEFAARQFLITPLSQLEFVTGGQYQSSSFSSAPSERLKKLRLEDPAVGSHACLEYGGRNSSQIPIPHSVLRIPHW